jgi:hypothetical protein
MLSYIEHAYKSRVTGAHRSDAWTRLSAGLVRISGDYSANLRGDHYHSLTCAQSGERDLVMLPAYVERLREAIDGEPPDSPDPMRIREQFIFCNSKVGGGSMHSMGSNTYFHISPSNYYETAKRQRPVCACVCPSIHCRQPPFEAPYSDTP